MSKKIRYPLYSLAAMLLLSAIIHSSTKKRPSVVLVQPENCAQVVSEHASISATIVNLSREGIDKQTLNNKNIYLTEGETGKSLPACIRNTAHNVITLIPDKPLKRGTTYSLHISEGVKDYSGTLFTPSVTSFTTGQSGTNELLNVKFEKQPLSNTAGQYTSLTIGPDGKLYALGMEGVIKRFGIKDDGTLEDPEVLYALQDAYGKRQQRLAIGLAFDPTSTAENLIAYVTHCSFMLSDAPDWDGKLTRLSGANLQNVQDILINLPRSAKDHLTNSITFGPDGALYFTQGSTTAMGAADKTWSHRSEHLLSAALLRLDMKKLGKLPLNVKTKEGGGSYNPFTPNSPLTIYATGLRNAYDLVWHSNGELYVPTNGSSRGGGTPASVAGALHPDGKPYYGPYVPALANVQQSQNDFLFRVEKGGYYGHPNPSRGEYVMNGGNPTPRADPAEVLEYPVGTQPDVNWRGFAYDFMDHKSPNGIIEYKSNTFDGALKGKLMVVRYSTCNDILILTPGGAQKKIMSTSEGMSLEGMNGFVMPLDLTEDLRNGNIYVAELGTERITLLRPKTRISKETSMAAASIKRPKGTK